MLGADVVVAELEGFPQAQLQHLLCPGSEGDVAGWLLLTLTDDVLHLLAHGVEGDVEGFQSLRGNTFTLVDEAQENVFGADVVVVEHLGLFLGQDNDATGAVSETLKHAGDSSLDRVCPLLATRAHL